MNKILKMNSFFTRIILAVLSFAVIVGVFIPYMRIPAVESVQDIDTVNQTLTRKIGKQQNTFNISEFSTASCPPFELYKDEALTETVDKTKVPLEGDSSVYYFATYAYGYDANDKDAGLQPILLKTYTVTFTKDVKNDSKTVVNRDVDAATINIRVPKATTFDFTRVANSKQAWIKQDSKMAQPFSEITPERELKSLLIEAGDSVAFYTAITIKSEINPTDVLLGKPEAESSITYLPLDVYLLTVSRDAEKNTLPVVGEIGGGLMSEEKNGVMSFYDKDAFMFTFMILGAVSTLLAFTIPNKFRIVELVVAEILGLMLVVIPIIDQSFYLQYDFVTDPGVYILIALGALIVLVGVFDFIRCRSDYKAEMVHIYGDDYFSKEKRKADREQRKELDRAYKQEMRENKEELKAAKRAAKEANKNR